jgi:hypothetical protein
MCHSGGWGSWGLWEAAANTINLLVAIRLSQEMELNLPRVMNHSSYQPRPATLMSRAQPSSRITIKKLIEP